MKNILILSTMKNILIIIIIAFCYNTQAQGSLQVGGIKLVGTAANDVMKWSTVNSEWEVGQISSSLTTGAFKTTSTPKGLSIAGDSLMLHPAGYTAPGAISLSDQFLGQGKKTVSKEANGVTTALVLYNALAADGDLGEGVGMDFLGGGETPMAGIYAAQNDVTGSTLNVNVRNAVGLVTMLEMNGETKTITYSGFQVNPSITISGIVDATLDANKSSSYILLSGSSLFLPNPANMTNGTYVNITTTNVTGSNAVINTISASAEFWVSGASTASSDIIFAVGAVKTGKLEVQTISGTKYWVLSLF